MTRGQQRFVEAQEDVQSRVADAQKSLDDFDFEPAAVREQARGFVNERVDAFTKEAKSRREALESRVEELRTRATATLKDRELTYTQLVSRGEALVDRIRNQESTRRAKRSAETTTAKAKTTKTQAGNAGKSTASSAKNAAKGTATTAKKQASKPKSSAKATGTAAKKTAADAAQATSDAASKVGS